MAFKQNPNKKARLEDLSKAALIKTVRTLQRRETKLLNQAQNLAERLRIEQETGARGQADRLLENLRPAVEFGYRAGERGVDNLEMTLYKWTTPKCAFGILLDDHLERVAVGVPHKFPWET